LASSHRRAAARLLAAKLARHFPSDIVKNSVPQWDKMSFGETINSYSNFFVPLAFIHSLKNVCAKFSRFFGKHTAQRERREIFLKHHLAILCRIEAVKKSVNKTKTSPSNSR
jgi:hypothetical protein